MRNLFIVILSLVSFCANAQYDYLSAKKILVSQSFRPGPDTTVNPLWVGEIRQSVEGGVGKIWICISLTGQKWQQISGSGGGGGDVASVFGRTGAVTALQADYAAFYEPLISTGTTLQYIRGDKSLATLNTSVVPESGNLYFTNARARGAISLTTTGTSGAATYNSTTGVLNIPAYEAGSGTVTNIATNTATGITGGPITTTGTLAIDTTGTIATKARVMEAIDSLAASIGLEVKSTGTTGEQLWYDKADTLFISRLKEGANITITRDADSSLTIASTGGGGGSGDFAFGGNTVGADTSIGTLDDFSLLFKTNGIYRGRVSNGGKFLWNTHVEGLGYKMFVADTANFWGIRSTGSAFPNSGAVNVGIKTNDASGSNYALRAYNSGNTDLFSVRNDGLISGAPWASLTSTAYVAAGTGLTLRASNTANLNGTVLTFNSNTTLTTSGTNFSRIATFEATFAPTSGTGGLALLSVVPTINQTGTAAGNVTGYYFAPTATSVLGKMYAIFAANGIAKVPSIQTAIAAKTTTYNATVYDHTLTGDATSAAFTITLPTAVGNDGHIYVIKKIDASANVVTVGTTSSQTIDGSTTYTGLSAQYKYVTVQSTGANWIIIGNN